MEEQVDLEECLQAILQTFPFPRGLKKLSLPRMKTNIAVSIAFTKALVCEVQRDVFCVNLEDKEASED